ncbi:MAG: SusC/RagA family TonB-linked outer membrane protein [Bacteroidales bacterium]|nr:SusC/RagA family TonB-linked outer membrane protein [Bacteroidales bacterium]
MKQFKYISCIVVALFCALSLNVQAQGGRWILKGVVTDSPDNFPVMGASVILETSNGRNVKGVPTDMDGNYMIEITVNDPVLHVKYIGYKEQFIKIKKGETVKNIVLQPDVKVLAGIEVVEKANEKTTDPYLGLDKRMTAASTTSVKIEDIAASPASSVTEMMQGRASGVQIVATSGDPGSAYTIRIRGNNSINGSSDPLIVIDGVPYDVSLNGANINDLTSSHSPLQNVNPADIASIEILKDAASTAIYGTKGANGVVLITTKRGAKNEKTVNFNSTFSISQAPTEVPLLSGNSQKTFILEGDQHDRDSRSSSGGSSNMDNLTYLQLRDDPNRDDFYYYNNNSDWVDLVTRTGYSWNNNVSLRGGGNTTRYSFSTGYRTDRGTVIGSTYNQFTANFNLDYNIANNLTFKSSIGYSRSTSGRDGTLGQIFSSPANPFDDVKPLGLARQYPAFLSVYEKDAVGNDLDAYYIPRPEHDNVIYSRYYYNPLAWTKYTSREILNNDFRSNVSIDWEIFKGIRLTSLVSVAFSNSGDQRFIPSEATNRDWDDRYVNYTSKSNSNNQVINQENILSFQKTIRDIHIITGNLVSRIRYDRNSSIGMSATNTGSPFASGVDASNRWLSLSGGEGHGGNLSGIASLHYSLLDRYIVQTTVNRTGSSKFGPAQRWGTFPTIALRYRLSGEPFMAFSNDWLSELSLIYSYGFSGNEPRSTAAYISRYSQSGSYLGEYGITANNLLLSSLRWEKSRTHNYSVQLGLFKDRITMKAEYYDKLTTDLLTDRVMPSTSGYTKRETNFGSLSNKGYELEFNAEILKSKLRWSVYGNFAANRNKITYWPEELIQNVDGDITWSAGNENTGYPALIREGDPLGSFYGFKFKGVFAEDADAVARDAQGNVMLDLDGTAKKLTWNRSYNFTGGDAIYDDLNHDGIISNRDRTLIGDANADFFGGIGSKLSWNRWRLDLFFQFQVGNDIINAARKDLEAQNGGTNSNVNQAQSVMRRWRKQGDVTDMPRVIFATHYNSAGSDKYVEDGSYLRLKSLALTYDISQNFCKKIGMRNASLTFNAYNLLTVTNYKGQDPEISIGGGIGNMGVDNSRTAVPRSYTINLALTF